MVITNYGGIEPPQLVWGRLYPDAYPLVKRGIQSPPNPLIVKRVYVKKC